MRGKRTGDHDARLAAMLDRLGAVELAGVAVERQRQALNDIYLGRAECVDEDAEADARQIAARAALLSCPDQAKYCEALAAAERANLAAVVAAPSCAALLACHAAARSGATGWRALEFLLTELEHLVLPGGTEPVVAAL